MNFLFLVILTQWPLFFPTGCILLVIIKEGLSLRAQHLLDQLPCLLEEEQDQGGFTGASVIPEKTNETSLKMLCGLTDSHKIHRGVDDRAVGTPRLDEQIGFELLETPCYLLKLLDFCAITINGFLPVELACLRILSSRAPFCSCSRHPRVHGQGGAVPWWRR